MEWQENEQLQKDYKIFSESGLEIPKELEPPLLSGYEIEILNFYSKVSTQWKIASDFGGSHLIGLDYLAIKQIAEIEEFELDKTSLSFLREIEKFVLKEQRKSMELQNAK